LIEAVKKGDPSEIILMRINQMNKKAIVVLVAASVLTIASRVFASGLVPCGGPGEKECDLCFLFSMVKGVVDFSLFTLIPLAAVLIILLCGFNLMTNRGSAQTTAKTKKVLYATLIGLIIIFGGWVAVNTALTAMGATAWENSSGTWWKFPLTCKSSFIENPGGEKDIEVCPDYLTS
jgi:hypothetical protein